jgi:phosphodiesterase/alkaline phosphatase D-like protein
MRPVHVTRRELIAAATVAGAYAAVPPVWGRGLLSKRARVGPGKFFYGVASGEPSHNAVTFWSRLETGRPRSGARLIVARDQGMRRVVATTVVPTGNGVGGALKVRLGGLRPATEYWYAFESGNDVSPIGRTRTAPPPGSATPLQMAFSSCQQYAQGFFSAHAHAATLPDLDLYMFLGDYVYEQGGALVRRVRDDPIVALDLSSYRAKYALYRTDPGLQELHRLHPTAHVWDDHELVNNYTDNNPPAPAVQRAAAYRAAFEWLPRQTYPFDRHRIYKRLSFGTMADVFLLDERQYRTGRNDGRPRSMLGEAQMQWLIGELLASRATWKIIAQQVVVARIKFGDSINVDAWDGYTEDRARLLGALEAAGVTNVVFLTGDVHVFMANLLSSDFETFRDVNARMPAATEFVGGSITSQGRDQTEADVQAESPWNAQYNALDHGYAQLDLAADRLIVDYLASDVGLPDGFAEHFERFVQPTGTNRFTREPPPAF